MRRLLHAALVPVLFAGATALAQDGAKVVVEDPRAGDEDYERAQALFREIRKILEDAAEQRQAAGEASGVSGFFKRQLGMDAQSRAKALLGAAFAMAVDAPVTRIQDRIEAAREEIAGLNDTIARLREERIGAPDDAGLAGMIGLAQSRETIDADIAEAESRIIAQRARIEDAKHEFRAAMAETGAVMTEDEADLLLDSVTGDDIVDIATAYDAVRGLSRQLMTLMDESGEDLTYAKRYYAMHTALIALLAHAQNEFIDRVDGDYLPRLAAVEGDVKAARQETLRLLREETTPRQKEALQANLDSQQTALDAADFYRRHLQGQRREIAAARERTERELRIADNTLRTVDASFQLRQMMENATIAFEALQNLESPGIERIFQNDQLRREFQELTEKLAPLS